MKKLVFVLITAFFASGLGWAATPVGPMNYQGRLLDNSGIPVTGSYDFVVKVYNAASAGTLKYQENLNAVPVDDGVYAFKIGNGPKTGGDSLWDTDLWAGNLNNLFLEVVVNGETLSPRHELTSAPHAYTATLALALGNKTAAQFDNILEGVCVASKGKWLASLNKCLGSGAVITNTAIPASDGLDYSNLELIDVNLTGTSFPSGANFNKTVFKDSTLSFAGFPANADLSYTRFENVTATTPLTSGAGTYGAVFKGINMSGFTFSGGNLWYASAAELSACPTSLPSGYGCREQFTGSGRYFVYGPYMNFSKTSALATNTNQGTTLELRSDAFSGIAGLGHSLQAANFSGVRIPANLNGLNLTQANFSDAVLERLDLSSSNLNNSSFDRAKISQVNFASATLGFVTFKNAEISLTTLQNGNYTDARFDRVILNGLNSSSVFSNTTFRDVSLSMTVSSLAFTNSLFTGTLRLNQGNGLSFGYIKATFDNCDFMNLVVRSEILFDANGYSKGVFFDNSTISNSRFRSVDFLLAQGNADNANELTFNNNVFNATVFAGNLKNTDFNGSTLASGASGLDGIAFQNGTVCPDNTTQGSGAATAACGNSGVGQLNW